MQNMNAQANQSVVIQLPQDLLSRFERLAKQRGQTFDSLALNAIERFLQEVETGYIASTVARRAANRVVFGDLAGLSLSVGIPKFIDQPSPVWRVPFKSFDGVILVEVDVDAKTGEVNFSTSEREALLDRVEDHYAKKK